MTINIFSHRYRGTLDITIKIDGEPLFAAQSVDLDGAKQRACFMDMSLPKGKKLHISGTLNGTDIKKDDAIISDQFDHTFELLDLSPWTSCLRDNSLNALERVEALAQKWQDSVDESGTTKFVNVKSNQKTEKATTTKSSSGGLQKMVIKSVSKMLFNAMVKSGKLSDQAPTDTKPVKKNTVEQEKSSLASRQKDLGVKVPNVLKPFENHRVSYNYDQFRFIDPAKIEDLITFHYGIYGREETDEIMPEPGTDGHDLYKRLMVVGVSEGDGVEMLVWDSKKDVWLVMQEGYHGVFEPAPLPNRVTNAPVTSIEALLYYISPVTALRWEDDDDTLIPFLGHAPTHPVLIYDSQAPPI